MKNVKNIDPILINVVDRDVAVSFGPASNENVSQFRAETEQLSTRMIFPQPIDVPLQKRHVLVCVIGAVKFLVPIPDFIQFHESFGGVDDRQLRGFSFSHSARFRLKCSRTCSAV